MAVPDLSEALTTLRNRNEMRTEDGESERLTPIQLSRMAYAIGALSHLRLARLKAAAARDTEMDVIIDL